MERRSVLVGLVAVGGSAGLVLAGCGPAPPPPSAPRTARTTRTDADTETDLRLVATALEAELAAVDALERTRRRHPSLRRPTATALAAHGAHVDLLRGASDGRVGGRGGRPRVPSRPEPALAALARAERALAAAHAATAMTARSGVLARAVASMSASSAQLQRVLTQAREA